MEQKRYAEADAEFERVRAPFNKGLAKSSAKSVDTATCGRI